MPRRSIVSAPGEMYHVVNRGVLKSTLIYADFQYWMFMSLLERYAPTFHVTIVAVCLMSNHFHLLIRVEEGGDLPKFMACVCSTYSRRLNRHLRRSGTIYQGRYHIGHVGTDSYLKAALRYIHLNPVKAGLVAHPAQYPYSDYREVLQQRSVISSEHTFVRSVFGDARAYEAFVTTDMLKSTISDKQLESDLTEAGLL
ncbi:MAG: transposase [Candidatus Kapaibacteriota bacterium]